MSWVSCEAVISEISWFFTSFISVTYVYLQLIRQLIQHFLSALQIVLFQLLNLQSYFLALMTVSLVSIRIPLPAASARYLRCVFFERTLNTCS